jgi:hypothetical protein
MSSVSGTAQQLITYIWTTHQQLWEMLNGVSGSNFPSLFSSSKQQASPDPSHITQSSPASLKFSAYV